ncbi:hypothetical protein JCM14469_08790 [Desulfatiferula olefinivorans]
MRHPHRFYTRTLADLYLAQGYLSDAEAAYRFLLDQHPDHPEITAALERIARLRGPSDPGDLVCLMKTWARLLRREKHRAGSDGTC